VACALNLSLPLMIFRTTISVFIQALKEGNQAKNNQNSLLIVTKCLEKPFLTLVLMDTPTVFISVAPCSLKEKNGLMNKMAVQATLYVPESNALLR